MYVPTDNSHNHSIHSMEREAFSLTIPIVFFLISHCCCFHVTVGSSIASASATQHNSRLALEIIIGGGVGTSPAYPPDNGGGCPDCSPPAPPPPDNGGGCPDCPVPQCPPPPLPPVNAELLRAVRVIQRFKQRIKSDPFNIISTWTGNRLCFDSSKYKGFVCDRSRPDKKFRLVGVNFNQFNFSGGPGCPLLLTDFIEDFPDLVIYHANSNNFAGDIPFGISKIPNLFELDLSNNMFVGAFPNASLGATNLTYLDLRFNQFAGPIPGQVFTLDLDVLFLNNNGFHGTIPENLGRSGRATARRKADRSAPRGTR